MVIARSDGAAVQTDDVWKVFEQEAEVVQAVRGVNLTVASGEFTAMAGPSGSGKTTLLNVIGGLTRASRGHVHVAGQDLTTMSNRRLARVRLDQIGFVFQAYNLLPVLTAAENAEFPLLLRGVEAAERRRRVHRLFERTGLAGLEDRRPGKLSGGQQQRVAVARAVVGEPALVLADEPTGNLSGFGGERPAARHDGGVEPGPGHDLRVRNARSAGDGPRAAPGAPGGRSGRLGRATLSRLGSVRRAALLAVLAALASGARAAGQLPAVRGYVLTVPSWSDSNLAAAGGVANVSRLRVMTEPSYGAFGIQAAYEQVLGLAQRAGASPSAAFAGLGPRGGEWLPLQWTLEESDHVRWTHRFDRLNVAWAPAGPIEVVAGRLTASWATTLFLTPADPFLPFDPSDPFRVYRGGVDAVRVQYFPGPLSDVDLIVRPTEFGAATEWSALVRGRTVWRHWEVSAWTGVLYDRPAAALGAAGGVGSVSVRGEVTVQDREGTLVLRGSVGVDGRLAVAKRDLYYVIEYQRDGFGAGRPAELVRVIQSEPFARGQLQVLGRDELVVQGAYQLHPLWALDLLVMTNVNDPSALWGSGAAYSASNEVVVRGGIYVGVGDATPSAEAPLPSEFGSVPTYVYLSVTAFF